MAAYVEYLVTSSRTGQTPMSMSPLLTLTLIININSEKRLIKIYVDHTLISAFECMKKWVHRGHDEWMMIKVM